MKWISGYSPPGLRNRLYSTFTGKHVAFICSFKCLEKLWAICTIYTASMELEKIGWTPEVLTIPVVTKYCNLSIHLSILSFFIHSFFSTCLCWVFLLYFRPWLDPGIQRWPKQAQLCPPTAPSLAPMADTNTCPSHKCLCDYGDTYVCNTAKGWQVRRA